MFYAVRIKDIPFALFFCLTFALLGGLTSWLLESLHWEQFELTVCLPIAAVLSLVVSIVLKKLIVRWVAYLDRTPPKPIRKEDGWALSPLPKPKWLK